MQSISSMYQQKYIMFVKQQQKIKPNIQKIFSSSPPRYKSYKICSPPKYKSCSPLTINSFYYVLPKATIKDQRVEEVEKHSYTKKNPLSKQQP